MTSNMKYVVFDGHHGEQIIVFPRIIQHSHFAEQVSELSYGSMHPISGGFVVNGECVGESESLRMKSRGDKDTALIVRMLDIESELELTHVNDSTPVQLAGISKNKAKRMRKRARR